MLVYYIVHNNAHFLSRRSEYLFEQKIYNSLLFLKQIFASYNIPQKRYGITHIYSVFVIKFLYNIFIKIE